MNDSLPHSPHPAQSLPGVSSLSAGGATLPRYHKRAFAHNYHAPFIYHLILKKSDGAEYFGVVGGDARFAPGTPGSAFIQETEVGKIIAKSIVRLQYTFPILQIYQYAIMPDHVHILLRVKEWTEKHLDFYVENLVADVERQLAKLHANRPVSAKPFQDGYCDKPLLMKRSLDALYSYIRENPHRLAMRQQFPQFFQRAKKLAIGGADYEAYGNLFLFRNPDKEAVKISRRFTPEETARRKAAWLSSASKGTILVSPFISKKEKEVRAEAEAVGGKVILITHERFSERFKPAAGDFALCAEGRLLIISLGLPPKTALSRAICLQMNTLAQIIATQC